MSSQQLIPYVEEDGSKHDDRGAASQLRFASEERREIMEVNKVRKLKLIYIELQMSVCHCQAQIS